MMGGWLFWLIVGFVVWRVVLSRGCWGRRERTRSGVEDQGTYVDGLETRVADLEERLDFTERLLAGRRELAG